MPDMHRIGVHHPGHGLLVRAEVWSGDVALRADPFAQLGGVAPGDALHLAEGELARIADHTPFGPAERNVDHRALPCHPGGQSAHFVESYVAGKAEATVAWAAHYRMVYAVAHKDLQVAAVHGHRNVHGDFLVGILQVLVEAFFEPQFPRGDLKARFRRFVDVELVSSGHRRHWKLSSVGSARGGGQYTNLRCPTQGDPRGWRVKWPGDSGRGHLPVRGLRGRFSALGVARRTLRAGGG